MRVLLFLTLCIALIGCKSGSKVSKTDVASRQKGGPSAEISMSFFSGVLQDEAQGKPVPQAWGSYEDYWNSRMRDIAIHQNKDYYNRVFRDFNSARLQLGLLPMTVPSYESFQPATPP